MKQKKSSQKEFVYAEGGDENLKILEEAPRFLNWMYEQVKPHLFGNIMEGGSGIGTYSRKIIKDFPKKQIILTEYDKKYYEQLKKDFGKNKRIHVHTIDLQKKSELKKIPCKVDSFFALNVFEHIEKDELALKNVYDLLEPNGVCVILVPAHKWLFNVIDESVDHFRRYTGKELRDKAEKAGFVVEESFFFNFFSIPGWYWNGNILKKSALNKGAVQLFNKLVPLFRFIEKYIFFKRLGISTICVMRKPASRK